MGHSERQTRLAHDHHLLRLAACFSPCRFPVNSEGYSGKTFPRRIPRRGFFILRLSCRLGSVFICAIPSLLESRRCVCSKEPENPLFLSWSLKTSENTASSAIKRTFSRFGAIAVTITSVWTISNVKNTSVRERMQTTGALLCARSVVNSYNCFLTLIPRFSSLFLFEFMHRSKNMSDSIAILV